MSNVSKLNALRKADKDREIELCQTIIDACETLGQIAQERGDGEYEMYWSRMSGMALDGPKTNAHALAEARSDDSQQRVVGGLNHEERP